MDAIREHYADKYFGLPTKQIKWFDELTKAQQGQVAWYFNLINPDNYVYAVKQDGNLVTRREKRNLLLEAQYKKER